MTIAQEPIGLSWLQGFTGFEPTMVTFKVKFRINRGEI
jgi:hypothetical protein